MSQLALFGHQKAAVDFLLNNGGSGALYMEMGTGKTRCGIELLIQMRKREPTLKMLVVCPLTLIESAWGGDITKFGEGLIFQNLRKKKKEFFGDILVCNYEMVRRSDFELTLSYLRSTGPLLCFLDESSRIKGYRTQTTQRILQNRRYFKYRVCASGTPAPNNELEYWPQLHFIQPGLFNENFYIFRIGYFWLARNSQIVDLRTAGRGVVDLLRQGYTYQLQKHKRQEFEEKLNSVSFTCKIDSCLDLPETIEKRYEIEMHTEQKAKYKEMEHHMITEIKGQMVAASIALTKLTKLRQLASGFIYDEEHPLEVPNPKLKELGALLEDIGNNQIIIWCNFHKERDDILSILDKQRVSVLDGSTKDKDDEIKMFKDTFTKYLVANPQSAGHGLTFTGCHHQVFYSLNYSYELFEQSKARTHRAGTTKGTVYHYLLMKNTIEEVILKVLEKKGSKQDILKEWMQ